MINYLMLQKNWKISCSAMILMVGVLLNYKGSDHQTNPKTRQLNSNSITFIMGEDMLGKNYFKYAKEYFLTDSNEQTTYVTEVCKTIECVIEYLNNSPVEKWTTINLVAHGNSKTGLNLFLSKDGHKATPKRMVQEVLIQNLPKIARPIFNKNTQINIYSCGIGTNPMISLSMKRIFSPLLGDSAQVICSNHFIVFKPDPQGKIQKIKANYWPYYYKRGYRPSEKEIAKKMEELFPSAKQNWENHLSNSKKEKTHTIDYHLPISFTRYYENPKLRPDFNHKADKLNWILTQHEIQDQLEDIDMEYNDFHWQVNKIKILQEDGTYRYAVKAIGMTTVLCFLEEV